MNNKILRYLKRNVIIRKVLYAVLKNYETKRSYSSCKASLYFLAGKNLNLFFSRRVHIEPQVTANLLPIITKSKTIFDIGANIGYYTVLFSKVNPDSKIFSFEPDPCNIKLLEKNIRINKCNNIEIIKKGISDKNDEILFYSDSSTGRTSSIDRSAWHPSATVISEIKIKTIRLDDFVDHSRFPDLIKCDIEGHEKEFLFGANNILNRGCKIILEVQEKNYEFVFKYLTDKGYIIYNAEIPFDPMNSVLSINFPNILAVKSL